MEKESAEGFSVVGVFQESLAMTPIPRDLSTPTG